MADAFLDMTADSPVLTFYFRDTQRTHSNDKVNKKTMPKKKI